MQIAEPAWYLLPYDCFQQGEAYSDELPYTLDSYDTTIYGDFCS